MCSFTISFIFFLLFHSCVSLPPQWPQAHGEHLNDLEWNSLTNSEQVQIRSSTREESVEKQWEINHRHHQKRQTMSAEDQLENIAEEIFGMAKKVAITIIVLVVLCLVCCLVSTIYICVRCCCGHGGNSRRKTNTPMTTIQIPQPVFIQSTPSPNYPPQHFQQQQSVAGAFPTSFSETHPMLPRPSAPPQPINEFMIDRPPPYEQICEKN